MRKWRKKMSKGYLVYKCRWCHAEFETEIVETIVGARELVKHKCTPYNVGAADLIGWRTIEAK
jgi:DNA-directed RNA polymerase subunit RPC12/RpoP